MSLPVEFITTTNQWGDLEIQAVLKLRVTKSIDKITLAMTRCENLEDDMKLNMYKEIVDFLKKELSEESR